MADEQVTETYDAANPAAEDNARRDAARHAREDADTLRLLMQRKQGRAWLYRKLEACHIYASTFAPGQADVTAFQLGEENVGKRIMLEAIDASPDLYMKMLKEQQDEARRLDDIRRTERKNREQAEGPVDVAGLVADLPPPAGYPGGPSLPVKPLR